MNHLHYHDAKSEPDIVSEKWWALRNIHVLEAWHIAQAKGRDETILLVGEPCLPHDELEGDALIKQSESAENFDGTCMATIAVSRQQGEIAGSAPAAQIIPVADSDAALGEVERGAGIVVTTQVLSPLVARTMKELGAIVIAPAGDDALKIDTKSEAIIVGGSTHDDRFWELSNRGTSVDFVAPANKVWGGAMMGDDIVAPVSGTLAALALVAGIAALWRAHVGADALNLRASEMQTTVHDLFKQAVVETVRCPNHWDEQTQGAGIIDAEALLRLPLDSLY